MGHTWHLYINEYGASETERNWKTIRFHRSLEPEPTKFIAVIKYYSDIKYWYEVRIKSGTTIEWFGYVERIKTFWNKEGRWLRVSGRCRKVIIWKKWVERFTDTREIGPNEETGFFGKVSAKQLLMFLLRTPVSDSVIRDDNTVVLNHKIGWGVAPENFYVQASPTVAHCKEYWVKSRYTGLAWRNRGSPWNGATLAVNSCPATAWTTTGASPYIAVDDGDTEKIYSATVDQESDHGFGDLEASATGINYIKLAVKFKTDTTSFPWWQRAHGYVYIWRASTSSWVQVGEWEGVTNGAWVLKEIDVTSILNNVSDVNAAKVRFTNKSSSLGTHITYAYMEVSYSTGGSQEVGDYFMISLSSSTDIMGILIECRNDGSQYARNYNIQYSNADNPDPTVDGNWSDFASGAVNITNNTFRDILHSWRPTTLKHIRIKITVQNTSYGWEISQIYVYKAEPKKYRAYLDGLSQPPNPPPYQGGPYITDMYFDSNYNSMELGQVNVPFGRLIDAIDTVRKMCHSNYVPFECWIQHSDGQIRFEDHRGSDKSATISFTKGTHLGGTTKDQNVGKTVQRIKIIGKGESKKQDDISSAWQTDTSEMDNVRSFYEEIISRKTVDNKTLGDLIANIYLNENAPVEELIECDVENDSYDAMAYDVGDDVMITDSLTGVSGSYRIHTIAKEINREGEHITLYLGKSWKDVDTEWAKIRKELRELNLTGTTIEDWSGEGSNQKKQSKVKSETESFESTAQNDDEEGANDKTDDKWYISGDAVNGQAFNCGDKWQALTGVNGADGLSDAVWAYISDRTLNFDQNPKLVCEFKIDVSGSYTAWQNDDMFRVGIRSSALTYGFGFRIKKESGVYNLYASLYDGTGTAQLVQVGQVDENKKYRVEAVVDWESRIVKYYVQDPDSASEELELRGLLEIDQETDPKSYNLQPLIVALNTTTPTPHGGQMSHIYCYKFKSEWKARQ